MPLPPRCARLTSLLILLSLLGAACGDDAAVAPTTADLPDAAQAEDVASDPQEPQDTADPPDAPPTPEDAAPEDAAPDVTAPEDIGPDIDTPEDAAPDVEPDIEPDIEPDADELPDAAPDADDLPDVEPDVEPQDDTGEDAAEPDAAEPDAAEPDAGPACGDGTLDPDERCDTAILNGLGACPDACDDGEACTTDRLEGEGCDVQCVSTPITDPADGDTCCPEGANANNDDDCLPDCGNGLVEGEEACDDGNDLPNDACTNLCTINPTIALRVEDIDIRDPHVWIDAFGCNDITDMLFFGYSLNNDIQTGIQEDRDNNGNLDQSIVLVFREPDAGAQLLEVWYPVCTAPLETTACRVRPATPSPAIALVTTSTDANCLDVLPDTTRPYAPPVEPSTPPCFVSAPTTLNLDLGGLRFPLRSARFAGTLEDDPITGLTHGLLVGFLTEAEADATATPSNYPVVGGDPLSSLLPGGAGSCSMPSDLDTSEGEPGWWVYLNFTATRVPWTDR